jgi:hypothetical protein
MIGPAIPIRDALEKFASRNIETGCRRMERLHLGFIGRNQESSPPASQGRPRCLANTA